MKHTIKHAGKTALLAGVAAMAISHAAFALDPNSWYVGASGDATWLNHSGTGGGGNIDLGYSFWPSAMGDWRLEGQAGYHGVPNEKGYTGNTHYFTYMGNLLYDFNGFQSFNTQSVKVVPYLGIGAGDATVKFGQRHGFDNGIRSTFADFSDHDNVFAYQGMTGLNFDFAAMPNTDWSLGYSYLGSDKEDGNRLNANNVELGVRFHF